MINLLCYHYKLSDDGIKKLTVHQFNKKMGLLNKMFSDKPEDKPEDKPSQNYGILDQAYGVK